MSYNFVLIEDENYIVKNTDFYFHRYCTKGWYESTKNTSLIGRTIKENKIKNPSYDLTFYTRVLIKRFKSDKEYPYGY